METQVVAVNPNKKDLIQELDFFLSSCEKLLITAARDLAILNKNDINAKFIVSLSLKCEKLQRIKKSLKFEKLNKQAIGQICRDLLLGLGLICHRAKQIDKTKIEKKAYDKFHLKINYWWHMLGTKY